MKTLVIVVLLVAVGVGGYWVYQQSQGQKPGAVTVSEGGQPVVNQESNVTPDSGTQAEKGNFSQKGNVSIQEDGSLWLVWDEPGKLALNVKLKFNNQSICYLGGVKKDCGQIVKSQENYYVSVEGNKTGDEVVVTKLEQLESPQ